MIVWNNGRLGPIEKGGIDPRDRGFTLGDGLYETICVRDGRLLRLDRHFSRLDAGLRLLDIKLKLDENALIAAMRSVLEANAFADAALRLTVSRGMSARGLAPEQTSRPTVIISVAPRTALPAPARVMIATVTRRNAASPIARVKTICCLDSILARMEAVRYGMDDAILLNGDGWVAEATAANIFAVIDGVLVTPPVSDGALPGVMRGAIMAHTPLGECSLSTDDLNRASEIFLTSSLGIRSVVEFEGSALSVGAVATRLAKEL